MSTTETHETPNATDPSGGRLGTMLMAVSVVLLLFLGMGLAIGLTGGEDDEPHRDRELEFVDDYDDSDEPEVEHRRSEDCNSDSSDAEEQFARDCSEDDRQRDGDSGGLFPDE